MLIFVNSALNESFVECKIKLLNFKKPKDWKSRISMVIGKYRPDIDGLRAISVLLVLFFHAGIFSVKAGFIGVDIFFVISGFLITTGIKNSLEKNQFSITTFFKKRLWRLQPVLIILLLVTTIMTALTYLPDDFLKFTSSAQYLTQFRSNQYFAGLDRGYFSEDTTIMPLLHTWSLSIEWQWYLFLPFLMVFFAKILKIKNIINWTLPLTLISTAIILDWFWYALLPFLVLFFYQFFYKRVTIVIAIFFTITMTIMAGILIILILDNKQINTQYYSFINRIFAMLIGSLLASIGPSGSDKIPNVIKTILGTISLSFIFYAASVWSVINSYPNLWAIGVCVSGAVLIYIGHGQSNNLITKTLHLKPLVWIGVISYSLYIWHWPVFSFIRNLALDENWQTITVALTISFLLATLSFYLIENKFRNKHTEPLLRTVCLLIVLPAVLIGVLNFKNQKHGGFPKRFGDKYVHSLNLHNQVKDIADFRIKCWDGLQNAKCIFEPDNGNKTIALIGDSYANHAIGFVSVLAKDAKLSFYAKTYRGCIAFKNIKVNINNQTHTSCMNATKEHFQRIKNREFNYVIFGGVWNRYLKSDSHTNIQGLNASISEVIKSGVTPVILNNTYDTIGQKDYSKYFYRNIKIHNYQAIEQSTFERIITKDDQWRAHFFQKLKKKYPELIIIDMNSIQCNKSLCRFSVNNYPVYRDADGHITDYASYQFGKEYLTKYGNPFKALSID